MTTARALVLIDLQNEFLTPEGNFPIAEPAALVANIAQLVSHFRSKSDIHVFWVRAQYPSSLPNEPKKVFDVLTGRHTSDKPCCYEGTSGAEFPPAVSQLIEPTDVVLTKTWYSAFKETLLEAKLRERGVEHVYFAGLLSYICVLSTVTEAQRRGFKTYVVEDCLGRRREESHTRALRSMRDLGIRVVSGLAPLESSTPSSAPTIPTLYYVHGSIPSWRVMMALYEKGIEFEAVRRNVTATAKETREPNFLALTLRGKAPVFVDPVPSSSGEETHPPVVINESLAILQYIETYHNQDVPLLPPLADRAGHALVLARLQETENLHNIYGALEDAHSGEGASSGPLTDLEHIHLIKDVCAELDFWEVYASRTSYIAGDTFSLADCAFFPLLAHMVHLGFCLERPIFHNGKKTDRVENAWPSLRAYFERIWERGGENGCAQRAQPDGWNRPGNTDVWKLTGCSK